jgi:hypothetical protein
VAGTSSSSYVDGTLTMTKGGVSTDDLAAGATVGGLASLGAASYDVTGGSCSAGSPRLNVVTADGDTHFFGCGPSNDAHHVVVDLSAAGDGNTTLPENQRGVVGKRVTSIDFVVDQTGTATVTNLSFTGTPTVASFGPFAGGSPDSGTCGNNWANDTFQRTFTVTTRPDGTQTLRQDYTDGSFTTVAGKSPGACPAGLDSYNGGTVEAGITGGFTGFTSGTLTCGEGPCAVPSPDSVTVNCSVPNDSACFVKAIFGANAVFKVATFKFNYAAICGFFLVERTWQNADESNGGNAGDIKSAPGTLSTVACATVPTPVATPSATPTPTPTVSPSALPSTGPTSSPTSTAPVSHLATTGAGSGVPWSGLALLLGVGLLLAVGGGVVVARTQFRRF